MRMHATLFSAFSLRIQQISGEGGKGGISIEQYCISDEQGTDWMLILQATQGCLIVFMNYL